MFNNIYLVEQQDYDKLLNSRHFDKENATAIVVPAIEFVDNCIFIKLDPEITNARVVAVFSTTSIHSSSHNEVVMYERVFSTEPYAYYTMDDTFEGDYE